MKPDRREFLGTLLGGAGWAVLAGCAGQQSCQQIIANRPVRRNVATLGAGHPILTAYASAITQMKALPVSDPRNWNNQAKIHNDHCPHGNWLFLPWHRCYLLYFERICRKLSGMKDFALPYWNWTTSPSIPTPFWSGALLDTMKTTQGDAQRQLGIEVAKATTSMDSNLIKTLDAKMKNGDGFEEAYALEKGLRETGKGELADKVVDLSREPRRYWWHESLAADGGTGVDGAELRRELANDFHASPVPRLLPTTAWVRVPDGLWEDPDAFESFAMATTGRAPTTARTPRPAPSRRPVRPAPVRPTAPMRPTRAMTATCHPSARTARRRARRPRAALVARWIRA